MKEFFVTPIGPVPNTFPYVAELMRMASIEYRDEVCTVNLRNDPDHPAKITGTEKRVNRAWYVVPDEELVPTTKRRTTGTIYKDVRDMRYAANTYTKFCMVMAFAEHEISKHENPCIEDILLVAMGKKVFKTKKGNEVDLRGMTQKLLAADVKVVQNTIARLGVPGYKPIGGVGVAESTKHPTYGKERMTAASLPDL